MPETSIFSNPDRVVKVDYGVDHPQYGKVDARRVKWSDAEIHCLLRLLERTDIKNSSKPFVLCLQAIKSDPNAQRIFHEHHLISHQRLRVGHQMYLRSMSKSSNIQTECYI
jgi:hypothetical protein